MKHIFQRTVIILACISLASPALAYDPTWSRSDCSTYSYHGLNERYVYGSNKGWINNNKWDSSTVEGVDCASYVSRCIALPDYVPEGIEDRYPYNTLELFNGVEHMDRIYSVYDLEPWDIWVWRSAYGGPSPGHTGLFVRYDGSYMITREALTESVGVVERRRRLSDMVDWGCRYYRRDNWNGSAPVVTAPTVTTNAASNVGETHATLNGTLNDDGNGSIDSRGFAWGTTSSCSNGWIDGGSSTGFSGTLSGLQPDTLYYYKAQAHNTAGWGSGSVRSFRTTAETGGSQYIIDNGQAGTSYTGNWDVSSGENPYGSESLWARDGASYTWRYNYLPAGFYEVSMWWTEFTSRGSAIPVKITHAAGTAGLTVNQQTNGGKWNVLGTYYFSGAGSVTLTADGSYPTSFCADAVRFLPVESNEEPVAVIDSISPKTATVGQQITMVGHGTDDGSISAYQWASSRDGVLGSTATLKTSGLSAGTHTISFKVRDNSGLWSDADLETVAVTASSVTEVIIDNGQTGTSYTGTWDVSGGENPYGSDSLWARDGATYTWQTASLEPGDYEVLMWWTEFSSRGAAVPIQVAHADGNDALTVNQQTNGGQWNSLGVYRFNNTGKVTLYATDAYPTSYSADAVRFVKVDAASGEEIVMDNGDSGTTSWGTWDVSGGADPYGSNSLWARDTGGYRWTFTPQVGGRYEVSLWWTEFSSRGAQIPVTVSHRYGNAAMTVNQQTDGGKWNVLGTYTMTAGQAYSVLVETAGDGSTVCADAIRVRWVSN